MTQKRLLVPTQSRDDWQRLLGEPVKHWKPGRSAMLCASTWENANGLPASISAAFDRSDDSGDHSSLDLVLAVPEYQTPLDGGIAGSQSDVFCVVRGPRGLVCVTVEAKVDETFGPTLSDWKVSTSASGVAKRLGQIESKLGLRDSFPDAVRYQLLHRLAAAVIEAERFYAKAAAMVVQSFLDDDDRNGFADFCVFAKIFGITNVEKNRMYRTVADGTPKLIGWVQENGG
jgi:hypothetical protein